MRCLVVKNMESCGEGNSQGRMIPLVVDMVLLSQMLLFSDVWEERDKPNILCGIVQKNVNKQKKKIFVDFLRNAVFTDFSNVEKEAVANPSPTVKLSKLVLERCPQCWEVPATLTTGGGELKGSQRFPGQMKEKSLLESLQQHRFLISKISQQNMGLELGIVDIRYFYTEGDKILH